MDPQKTAKKRQEPVILPAGLRFETAWDLPAPAALIRVPAPGESPEEGGVDPDPAAPDYGNRAARRLLATYGISARTSRRWRATHAPQPLEVLDVLRRKEARATWKAYLIARGWKPDAANQWLRRDEQRDGGWRRWLEDPYVHGPRPTRASLSKRPRVKLA